jgi:SAM-dependent methyltransferase
MTPFLRGLVQSVAETFELPEPIVEIGSYLVPGQEKLANLRPLFPGKSYLGLDQRPGPGVDQVQDVESLDLPDEFAGTVIALSTFEHVPRFWRGFDEVRRILRPGGAFLVACPFYFHIHAYPSDYWRFTPEALRLLLSDYASLILGWQGPRTRPANVWALAFCEGRAGPSEDDYRRFQAALARHARQPLPWRRRLRYLLGRLICGRRPFAPWLDRDRCEMLWLPGSSKPQAAKLEQSLCLASELAD